jgi:SAM-dependent methyltransferase
VSPNHDVDNSGATRPQPAFASNAEFLIVTERGGELVSRAQLQRFHQRYFWAGELCVGKDVLELACGTGPGLGYLASRSKSLRAGDLDPQVLAFAREHYRSRLEIGQFDAVATPFADASFDVVILFEAIYYLPDPRAVVSEARRLLRPAGKILLATANRDLFDFNPSPFSRHYFNPPELAELLRKAGFSVSFFGGSPAHAGDGAPGLLRLIKRLAVKLHLIPRSMQAKRLLKRLVFGRLVRMPRELRGNEVPYVPPVPIDSDMPDTVHQVIYCVAVKDSP